MTGLIPVLGEAWACELSDENEHPFPCRVRGDAQ